MSDILFDIRQIWIPGSQPVIIEVSGPKAFPETTPILYTADNNDNFGFAIDLGRSSTQSTLILQSGEFVPRNIIIPVPFGGRISPPNVGLCCQLLNSTGVDILSGINLFAGVNLLDTAPLIKNGDSVYFKICNPNSQTRFQISKIHPDF